MGEIALPYFLALPETPGPWPGIVVIHEGGGISQQLLRVCQRLAAEGFAAVAPDLFFRSGGTGAGDYAYLMGAMTREQALADIHEAAGVLRAAGAGRIGVTGFCMGGGWAYRAAVLGHGFDAAVGFYGAGIHRELAEPGCPTLMFFGGNDEYVPAADLNAITAYLPNTVVYPDAGHGFMRDGSENYDEKAAADAWPRTLAFFREHLAS